MSKTFVRVLALLLSLTLVAAACSGDDDEGGGGGDGTTPRADIDYEAIGLWDDGACDESRDPLTIGLTTVFESPVISLKDQATALEASAKAFNARGGANGACIKVVTCDDGGNVDQAVGCTRTLQDGGVVATVNDQVTAGQAEYSSAMAEAGIPRVAGNVVSQDWGDQNAYPLDASGTGSTFLMPQGLIEEDIHEIGIIRVDLAAASALVGLLEDTYEGKATFPVDLPVPGGTTDYGQFILKAQEEGAGGVMIALGEQEGTQIVKAAQQLGSELLIGATLGTFSHKSVGELGDFAKQMVFVWSFPPATFDLPVYTALRDDLAASGEDALQPENLKASPMRSWIGLYALLRVLRDANVQEFTGKTIKTALEAAKDVPMLDIFGGEDWTPDLDHPGTFQRAGTNYWASWTWDPEAKAPDGLEGNFVRSAEFSFDEILCGTPFGGPEPC